MNVYTGHPNQICGVEEMRLSGGKADGMRMLYVRNGKGLDFWVSVDRCADISRLSFKGDNFGYFTPCGYVSPKYYDDKGDGFLKSFNAGFITTCGLRNVGNACTDNGEELPLHGSISNMPCESISYWSDEESIHIKATIYDMSIYTHKLILEREYVVSRNDNVICLRDEVKNVGITDCPIEILYHCNMGYPLLDENAKISIPSSKVEPKNEYSKSGVADCLKVEKPKKEWGEMCFYHTLVGCPEISIFNSKIKKGLKIGFDTNELKCFAQWKMMGEYDYVMGLEPGNCYPDGRDVMREKGILKFLKAGEKTTKTLNIEFYEK
jgi:galactose mutarotase-like enzyme